MAAARFLREQTVTETRWAALDARGEAIALYLEPALPRLALGERIAARMVASDPAAGGTFLDTKVHGGVFLRTKRAQKASFQDSPLPPEGAEVLVEVVTEARGEKLPRVKLADPGEPPGPAGADAWRLALKGGANAPVEDVAAGDEWMEAAFSTALSDELVLPGGGKMRIERTRALTAVDIDTAGRVGRGSAAARALSINREAAAGLAREILVRGLGGLFVLDCIAPLNAEAGVRVRTAFQEAWKRLTERGARALPPSPLGLMEAATDWWITPLAERTLEAPGQFLPEALACQGMRLLESEAASRRMDRLTLSLPERAYDWLMASGLDVETKLAAKYGARLKIGVHAKARPDVSPGS